MNGVAGMTRRPKFKRSPTSLRLTSLVNCRETSGWMIGLNVPRPASRSRRRDCKSLPHTCGSRHTFTLFSPPASASKPHPPAKTKAQLGAVSALGPTSLPPRWTSLCDGLIVRPLARISIFISTPIFAAIESCRPLTLTVGPTLCACTYIPSPRR
jgi:hypothetical protein